MLDFLKLIEARKAAAIALLGLVSGLMSFLFLAFINLMVGVTLGKQNTSDINYVLLFVFLMLFFMWSKRAMAFMVIRFSQQTLWRLRTDVLHTILSADFSQFRKRRDQLHVALIQDVSVLTNFSLSIIYFLSSCVITLGCFIYMGMQSRLLFGLTLGVTILGLTIYTIGTRINKRKFQEARDLENNFMRSFTDILSGFKEIYMNPAIGSGIFDRKIRKISTSSFRNNLDAHTGFVSMQLIGEMLFNSLVAFILIYGTVISDESPAHLVNFVFILLYLLGSINGLLQVIPGLVQARIAAGRIAALKKELSEEHFETRVQGKAVLMDEFKELSVTALTYTYESEGKESKAEDAFTVGPVDLSLQKGEVIFIYGGNGSGKTTLINAILGVLKNSSGTIAFNGQVLTSANAADYRSLFSIVFSDFHLFEELYGFETISEEQVSDYLDLFELTKKVSYTNGAFSTGNLSTGQRKRLALIIALLRNRPVLVLDEWAADQDPVFRKKFYVQIIPQLSAKGFSIIAITHDDAYYHVADKLYKMGSGQLTLEAYADLTNNELL